MDGSRGGELEHLLFFAVVVLFLIAEERLHGVGMKDAEARTACGVERWTVKTLQDRPHLLRTRAATVAQLVSMPAPGRLLATRLSLERRVYRLVATVSLIRWPIGRSSVLWRGQRIEGSAPVGVSCSVER